MRTAYWRTGKCCVSYLLTYSSFAGFSNLTNIPHVFSLSNMLFFQVFNLMISDSDKFIIHHNAVLGTNICRYVTIKQCCSFGLTHQCPNVIVILSYFLVSLKKNCGHDWVNTMGCGQGICVQLGSRKMSTPLRRLWLVSHD